MCNQVNHNIKKLTNFAKSEFIFDAKKALLSLRKNQTTIAKEMKCSRQFISLVMVGDTNPTLKTLAKFAFYLKRKLHVCLVDSRKEVLMIIPKSKLNEVQRMFRNIKVINNDTPKEKD